jgi:hypothetical protein
MILLDLLFTNSLNQTVFSYQEMLVSTLCSMAMLSVYFRYTDWGLSHFDKKWQKTINTTDVVDVIYFSTEVICIPQTLPFTKFILTILQHCQYEDLIGYTDWWIGKDLEGGSHVPIRIPYGYFHGGTAKNTEICHDRRWSGRDSNWLYVLNKSLECYCYIKLVGRFTIRYFEH